MSALLGFVGATALLCPLDHIALSTAAVVLYTIAAVTEKEVLGLRVLYALLAVAALISIRRFF